MTTTRKVTNFAKQALALLTGDTDKAIVLANERKCNSALESQISVLKGKVVDQEEAVNEAKEALNKAKFPTTRVDNREYYLQQVVRAQERLDKAEEDLAETNEKIAYWRALSEEFAEQVDAPGEQN